MFFGIAAGANFFKRKRTVCVDLTGLTQDRWRPPYPDAFTGFHRKDLKPDLAQVDSVSIHPDNPDVEVFIQIYGEVIGGIHEGQDPTCFKCFNSGHMSKDCEDQPNQFGNECRLAAKAWKGQFLREAEQRRFENERDHLAAEQEERDRLAAEQEELDRLEAEQEESDRLVSEQAEQDRLAAEQAEHDQNGADQDRLEQAERDRLVAERTGHDRLVAE